LIVVVSTDLPALSRHGSPHQERSGFAENFDALTGDGLRDRAYTWTASVYLLLADADSDPGSAPLLDTGKKSL